MISASFRRYLHLVATLFFTSQASLVQAKEAPQTTEAVSAETRDFSSSLAQALASDDYRAALALLETRPDISARADGIRLKAALLARVGRNDEAMALLESW